MPLQSWITMLALSKPTYARSRKYILQLCYFVVITKPCYLTFISLNMLSSHLRYPVKHHLPNQTSLPIWHHAYNMADMLKHYGCRSDLFLPSLYSPTYFTYVRQFMLELLLFTERKAKVRRVIRPIIAPLKWLNYLVREVSIGLNLRMNLPRKVIPNRSHFKPQTLIFLSL